MHTDRNRLLSGLRTGLMLLFLLAACTPPAATPSPLAPTATPPPPAANTAAPTAGPALPSAAPPAANPPAATPTLPAEKQQAVNFTAEDGTVIEGIYYPASVSPAPLVILMHQYDSDRHQWDAVAPWLQNRGGTAAAWQDHPALYQPKRQTQSPWLDSSWFPPVPPELKVAVLTFNFRFCDGRCKQSLRKEWVVDALAAAQYGATLPGVDPKRLILVGTSIGADGAVDGCLMYNQENGDGCLGAMSLSPGNYLLLSYQETATKLVVGGAQVWCIAGEDDMLSATTCRSVNMPGYRQTLIKGGAHGIGMLDPKIEVNVLQSLLQFLDELLTP